MTSLGSGSANSAMKSTGPPAAAGRAGRRAGRHGPHASSRLVPMPAARMPADPFRLRPGEAERLLDGHPWTRFAVLGDSIAEGVGDAVDGYGDLGWADRVAA